MAASAVSIKSSPQTSSCVMAAAGAPKMSASAEEIQPIGIQIGGWKIITRNSSIGDEKSMEDLTLLLEETANDIPIDVQGTKEVRRKRRMCPPEITFLDAIISFKYQKGGSSTSVDEVSDHKAEIRFTARDALLEWAEAHRYLKMQHDNIAQSSSASSCDEYRGVSIIHTVDAKIWSNTSKVPQKTIKTEAMRKS